jgi:hypothetical protein
MPHKGLPMTAEVKPFSMQEDAEAAIAAICTPPHVVSAAVGYGRPASDEMVDIINRAAQAGMQLKEAVSDCEKLVQQACEVMLKAEAPLKSIRDELAQAAESFHTLMLENESLQATAETAQSHAQIYLDAEERVHRGLAKAMNILSHHRDQAGMENISKCAVSFGARMDTLEQEERLMRSALEKLYKLSSLNAPHPVLARMETVLEKLGDELELRMIGAGLEKAVPVKKPLLLRKSPSP